MTETNYVSEVYRFTSSFYIKFLAHVMLFPM